MNLSKIMKRAWEIKKEDSRNIFGLCLKMAWEEAKEETVKKAARKDWFLYKKFGKEVNNFGNEITIEKETDKAVYGTVSCDLDIKEIAIWVPKSCLC